MKEIKTSDVAGLLAKSFLHSPLSLPLIFLILLLGFYAVTHIPRNENPPMIVSGATIIFPFPGANKKEIEEGIIKPFQKKLKEITGIYHILGSAEENSGLITVVFNAGESQELSNIKVYDKIIKNLDLLPKNAITPIIKTLDTDTDIPIVSIAFYAPANHVNIVDLTAKAKNIAYAFNTLEDVSSAKTIGGRLEQYNILLDLHKLYQYRLSVAQIIQSLKSLSSITPSDKVYTLDNTIVKFKVKKGVLTASDIENTQLSNVEGQNVYLKEIATISKGENIQLREETYLSIPNVIDSAQQVTLIVSKAKGSNGVIVADRVLEKLKSMESELQQSGIAYLITRNHGERANHAINELILHIFITIAVIMLLLMATLGMREAIVVAITIPLILAITVLVTYVTGQSIHRVTLLSYLLSLGILVDAAIIVIENIHRHMNEHGAKDKSLGQICIEATDEIGKPTNVATFAIIITIVPILVITQLSGEFTKAIPYNVSTAMIASLFVAYMFTPYLANKLLKKH